MNNNNETSKEKHSEALNIDDVMYRHGFNYMNETNNF